MSRKKKQTHVNHERWMVSYADFVTLLFAFFVVMFASSQQDHKKTREAEYSIRTAFQSMGIFPVTSKIPNLTTIPGVPAPTPAVLGDDFEPSPKVMADLNKIKRTMEQLLGTQIAAGSVSISIGRGGLSISLHDAGFFEVGSAIPKSSSVPTLVAIGNAIAASPYNVRVEGHTDNVPIHNAQYASNWELSTARATVLTRLFIENDHILPGRLSAAGYAQYHPIASNLTAEGRSRNRRVDIIVLPTQQQATAMERVGEVKMSPVPASQSVEPRLLREFLSRASESAFSRFVSTKTKPTPLR